jgi:hypothetical protein
VPVAWKSRRQRLRFQLQAVPGAIRELYGGAEDFRVRDRRLTHATTVENTPECRVGIPILENKF